MDNGSLALYLERVGYSGKAVPDLDTLFAVHRAHALAIPYENLEIQLGRENALEEDAFVDKLVRRRRGGWCYEMNGLITRVLREIGFEVTRVGGAVAREILGDGAMGNHLVGLVDFDRRYVVDVGLGDGPLDPFPLEEGEWTEGGLRFALERLDDGWWRFHNHEQGMAQSFDFDEEPRQLPWYQEMCSLLQVADFSPFVQYAIVSRRTTAGYQALRDTTWLDVVGGEKTETVLSSGREYALRLGEILGCDLGGEVETLWRKVESRASGRAARAGSPQ